MFCLLFIVRNFLCEGAKLSEKKDFILDFTKIDEGGVQPFLAHQGEIIKAISKFVDIDEEQVKIQVIKERNQSALKVDVMLNDGA